MAGFSLYDRMREHGTLSETPADIPDARFALPSAIHWIGALALLVYDTKLDFAGARKFYTSVQRRTLSDRELNTVYEQLLFALHQMAALEAIATVPNKADVARIGIVAWYYGVYGAASAMIAAGDGSNPDTHTATANQWERQFAANRLVMSPFADRVSSLTKAQVASDMEPLRARGKHSLTVRPTSAQEAWGCVGEYLSGTAGWEQWNIEERVKLSREFKDLGVDSFRSAAARALRDAAYAKRSIAFLHEASRYRGKANYRDAIFLAYGKSVPKLLDGFIADLAMALRGFAAMAAAYCAMRLGRVAWTDFIEDLEAKRAVTLSPQLLWS